MRKINRRRMSDDSGQSVWRSYSDMMSGLLLLFVLLMAVCLMQAQKNYTEKLQEQAAALAAQDELAASQSTVEEQAGTLEEQEAALQALQAQLTTQESELEEKESNLTTLQAQLTTQESELTENQALLAQKESELSASQEKVNEQEAELTASQAKLEEQTTLMAEQQAKIDQIIGVKADLIASLNEQFQANQISVDIDSQTGAIVLDSSVLFDLNESVLTEAGQQILSQILPVYCSVLLNSEYEDYLAEIIIDGYTDTSGDYISNLSLSQNRAFAVAEFLYETKDNFLTSEQSSVLTEKLTANGRSMSNPILDENGQVDMEASRRVEIKFRLKDEEMISELQSLISEADVGQN